MWNSSGYRAVIGKLGAAEWVPLDPPAVVASRRMWCTVLVLALVATADPVRIGVSVGLSARAQSLRPLIAFWLGGMAISAGVAAGVLFGLRDATLAAVHRVQAAAATSAAGHVQIAMGALALLVAAIAVGLSPRQGMRVGMPGGGASPSRLLTRVQGALQARPVKASFALGVGMLVDFRLLAALTAIVASGVATAAQIVASGMYILIALSFVELPLLSRLAAPAKTDRIMAAVDGWTSARRQQVFAVVIGLLGVLLMTRGIGHA